MTPAELAAAACPDCPAQVAVSRGRGLLGRVLVAAVAHEPSCPWLARYAPGGAVRSNHRGVLIHSARPA